MDFKWKDIWVFDIFEKKQIIMTKEKLVKLVYYATLIVSALVILSSIFMLIYSGFMMVYILGIALGISISYKEWIILFKKIF